MKGERSMCTYGECCHDEQCERWTWRAGVVTVLVFVAIAVVGIVEAFH